MVRKLNLGLVLVLFLSLTIGVLVSGCAGGEPETYKVGALFAVSGRMAPLGKPEKDAALMLERQINEAGGINGKNIEIIVRDTEGDETKAVTLAKELLDQDKVLAIIGPTSSGESRALLDTMTKAKTPLVSCAASITIVTPVEDRYWIFKTPQSDVLAIGEIFDYMKPRGWTKVAILTDESGFGMTGKTALEEAAAADAAISIVTAETFPPEDTDMTPQVSKIKRTDAQALIVWGTNPGPAIISKNAKMIGLDIPVFNSHGIANKEFIELGGDAVNGVVFPSGKILLPELLSDTDPQKSVLNEFREDFKSEYGELPNTYAGHAYDAIMMVKLALEKVGADKAKIRDELENIKNFAGTGGIFNMSPQEHNGLGKGAFMMVQIKDGKWAPAD